MNLEQTVDEQINIFFDPKSVAVVGASRKVNKAGYVIFKNFAENKRTGLFKGDLYPINPSEDTVLGYKCYPTLVKVPIDEIELVVVIVPAAAVPQVMEDASQKKAKAAIIITSGFGETGNHELENRVREICFKSGIRVLGPNCLGVYDPLTGIDTLFLPETKVLISGEEVIATPRPIPGEIAVVTQSGAFGAATLDYLAGRQLGISKFVSFGNRLDLDESDLLQYFFKDESTKGILVYLEGIKDGKRFMEISKKVTEIKPVVVLKTGRTIAGAKAAMSHTGSMAGADDIYNTVFLQTGIIRASDMNEFFDNCKALVFQPPASGNNIAIITDAGGPGIMASDECEFKGLRIGELSRESVNALEEMRQRKEIPEYASISNPIDLTGSVTTDMFVNATKIILEDSAVNGIIILGLHHVPGLQEDFIDRIANLTKHYTKPVVFCDIGETEMALYVRSKFEKFGIPAYASPEDAARAMASLYNYGLYLLKQNKFDDFLNKFMKK
jgi:acyl-CoA synthetase (NDP forming)